MICAGITITPPVPVTAGAEASEMGKAVKVIIMFKERFWPAHMLFVFCSDSIVSQMWMDPPRTLYPECHLITGYITGSQVERVFWILLSFVLGWCVS